jgi:hemin uptake protein HemP
MSDQLHSPAAAAVAPAAVVPAIPAPPPQRISSRELIKDGAGVEIDHNGRIYKLRITQLGKLILTA